MNKIIGGGSAQSASHQAQQKLNKSKKKRC